MKKTMLGLAVLMTATFVSCNNDQEVNGNEEASVKVSAGINESSRTALGSNASTVTWSSGDKIYLFDSDGASDCVMTLTDGAGTTLGTFTGVINGELAKMDRSLYPVPTVENGTYSFDLPSVRVYSEDSNAPMIGNFNNATNHVSFENLAAMVRVGLYGQNVTNGSEITLTLNGDGNIAGKAVVDLQNGKLLEIEGNGRTVTITGVPADAPYVDIPVPAATYTGYKVTLNGEEIAEKNESQTLGEDDTAIIGQVSPVEYVAFSTDVLQSEEEMNVDYAILGSDGLGCFYEFQEENPQLPERVVIWNGNKSVDTGEAVELEVNFNEQGLPTSIIAGELTIVLGNHEGNTFDAFAVLDSGESELYEDLELQDGMTWESYLDALSNIESRAPSRNPNLGPINLAVNGVGCAISVSAAIVGAPTVVGTYIGWAMATLSCGSAFAGIANQMGWIDTPAGAGNVVNAIAAFGSCVRPSNPIAWTSCFVGIAGTITGLVDQWLNDHQDEIQLGNGALISGNGDVKITLTWNKPSDIDLHCDTPSGAHIYFGDKRPSGTNGWLDFDNIPGFPTCTDPENIFFNPAEPGTYRVSLHYFSDRNNVGPVNYKVVILINGVGRVYEGVINYPENNYQHVEIATFTIGEGSRAVPSLKAATWDWSNLPAKK